MQSTFWWVWLLAASCVWILQRFISGRSDKIVSENELTLFWGAVRIVLITVMVLCFALSLILFVEWLRSDSHRLALQRPHALGAINSHDQINRTLALPYLGQRRGLAA